jgi:hypothetical protein
MKDLSNCITRLAQELRTLQEELRLAAIQSSDPSAQALILNDLFNRGLIQDLKSAVDHMRQFLWNCIDCAAADCSLKGQADQALQRARLAQVTEMLRSFHGSPESTQFFLGEVTVAVDRLLEKHGSQNTPSGEWAA